MFKLARLRPLARGYAKLSVQEEATLHEMKEQMLTKSFANTEQLDMDPKLREKLNAEFYAFVKEFVHDYNYQDEILDLFSGTSAKATSIRDLAKAPSAPVDGNMKGFTQFPRLERTNVQQPYTSQELYARQIFHAKSLAGVGAHVSGEYKPHEDLFKPKSEASIQTLLSAGAHLGHHTSRLRASTLPFIYGVRQNIHIIDLNQTMTYLKRATAVVQGVAERGGIVLFVGTREGQERTVELAAQRSGSYYVHTKWMPGTLTNAEVLGNWEKHEVDMGDQPTGRKLDQNLSRVAIKPDLVVCLNPVENRVLLRECIAQRVPTIGVIDTDSEPSLVTYPIPANDDSGRCIDLLVGVLSNAARRGRSNRLADLKAYKRAEENAKNAQGFNQN